MEEKICGYVRISFDIDDKAEKNVSIETQKKRIIEYISREFPNADFDPDTDMFEDRDRTGFNFNREGYQKMKRAIGEGRYNTLIVKDVSRFTRRASYGIAELEEILELGCHIYGCDDGTKLEGQYVDTLTMLEVVLAQQKVTESAKKVRNSIRIRQKDGSWVCNAPYGYYIKPGLVGQIFIDEEGREAVKKIFELYCQGYGYKSISHYLTEHHYPTGRQLMVKQMQEQGRDTSAMLKTPINPVWSAVSVAKIVQNDFYVGTLRCGVWTRPTMHGKDRRAPVEAQQVHENHHEPLIDMETWEAAQRMYRKSTRNNYSGVALVNHAFTGLCKCADCGSRMFAQGGTRFHSGYNCSNYMKNGLKGNTNSKKRKYRKIDYSDSDLGCSSHFVPEEILDAHVRVYLEQTRSALSNLLVNLDEERVGKAAEKDRIKYKEVQTLLNKAETFLDAIEESKIEARMAASSEGEKAEINKRYDRITQKKKEEIKALQIQLDSLVEKAKKRNRLQDTYAEVIEEFDRLLLKPVFSKTDLAHIIEEIIVDSDRVVRINLKSDIVELFNLEDFEEE